MQLDLSRRDGDVGAREERGLGLTARSRGMKTSIKISQILA